MTKMKTKKQDNQSTEVLDVERFYIANVGGIEVLFIKLRNKKAAVYRLPSDFLQKIVFAK